MAKFSGRPARRNYGSPVQTTQVWTPTYEGGSGWSRDPESDLFLLAATNMVAEDTFYETAKQRDARYVDLIHQVTKLNPAFIAGVDPENGKIGLAQYLRQELLMRSAAVVMAAEYIAAGGPNGRSVVARALQRPDEPAEILAYWLATKQRPLPMALKRGVADAVRRMYNERAALKYNGGTRAVRMADVIELVHPRPRDEKQSKLFKWLLDNRHHDVTGSDAHPDLPMIYENWAVSQVPEEYRRSVAPERLAAAGMTWERLSSWLPGGMDAKAWEIAIPNMGVMALIRNLRNFDNAGIGNEAIDYVINKITDPSEVEKARLFPFNTWLAYKNAPSDTWKRALARTLEFTTANIPRELDGTLVLIDVSGSMGAPLSQRSELHRYEVGAVAAAALWKVNMQTADVVCFGTDNTRLPVQPGMPALAVVTAVEQVFNSGRLSYGTNGHTAMARHFDPKKHRRVVMFTDDQMHDSGRVNIDHIPLIYTVNLGGYRPASTEAGKNGRHTLGGFSDATFTIMKVLEMAKNADWPF